MDLKDTLNRSIMSMTKIVVLMFLLSCSSVELDSIYSIEDMDKEFQAYYIEDFGKDQPPGIVCGKFFENKDGCFKLISNKKEEGAIELVYEDSTKHYVLVKKFNPPNGFIFLSKRKGRLISSSKALDDKKAFVLKEGQDAVELHYYEKSTVVYYWNENKFDEIWVSD